MKSKKCLKGFCDDQRGEFGIKQIAITVAVIVIIGVVVTIVRGLLPTWISNVWDMFMEQIQKLVS